MRTIITFKLFYKWSRHFSEWRLA